MSHEISDYQARQKYYSRRLEGFERKPCDIECENQYIPWCNVFSKKKMNFQTVSKLDSPEGQRQLLLAYREFNE